MAPPACSSSHRPIEIGREADLRFDFFLAIAVIVIGNDGHHDAAGVPAHQLECAAVVVFLASVAPAHALQTLALGRLLIVRQTEILLLHAQ